MEQDTPQNDETSTWKLYKRRWFLLLILTLLQLLIGTSFSMFGQISDFFVQYFHVTYTQVDWLTLSVFVAPTFTTFPFAWLAFRKSIGFRIISIGAAVTSAIGYACFAISMASGSLFSICVIGQTVTGISAQFVLTTPSLFAALWFPENEVGTAIGINTLGLYVGNIIGLLVPVYLLKPVSANSTVAERLEWINEDRMSLLWMYLAYFAVAVVIIILLCVFVTDTPPTPPTIAQKRKRDEDASTTVDRSFATFMKQCKAILFNRTVLCSSVIFGVLFQCNTVEFTMMAEIVRQSDDARRLHLDPSIVGAWTMFFFALGNMVGTLLAGKLVDSYKRYDRLSIIGTFLTFLSSVVIVLGLVTVYELFYVGNFLQGVLNEIPVVAMFDTITQLTYPIDETVVSMWMVFLITPYGIFFGEIGRVLFDGFSGMGVLAFQCISLLVAFVLSFFLKPIYKRLEVAEDDDGQASTSDETERLIKDDKSK